MNARPVNARQRLARLLRMIEMAIDALPESDPGRAALEASRRDAEAALYGSDERQESVQ